MKLVSAFVALLVLASVVAAASSEQTLSSQAVSDVQSDNVDAIPQLLDSQTHDETDSDEDDDIDDGRMLPMPHPLFPPIFHSYLRIELTDVEEDTDDEEQFQVYERFCGPGYARLLFRCAFHSFAVGECFDIIGSWCGGQAAAEGPGCNFRVQAIDDVDTCCKMHDAYSPMFLQQLPAPCA